MEEQKPDNSELDTLEGPTETNQPIENPGSPSTDNDTKGRSLRGVFKLATINIYLLLFIGLIIIAGIVTYVGYEKNKSEEAKKDALLSEPLSQETLDKLKQSDVRVGDPKQVLSVESNAVFAGKVLIRDSLEVAGQIKAGGPLNLTGLTVSGSTNLNQIKTTKLEVSGDSSIQGQLSVQNNVTIRGSLNVSGGLTAGQLTLSGLQVSGDLKLGGHIDAGGNTPSKSNKSALGSGGSASISGTDTAGSVKINTGGGSGSGCYVTITFSKKFSSTPHIVITPVGSSAGALNYYINRDSSGFSICSTNSAGSGKSFSFDYHVIE